MATPPPSSQSHFTKFNNFVPDDKTSFDEEFSRLASSQEWKPGSQEYVRQRTIAMRDEIEFLYFSQPDPLDTIEEEEDLPPPLETIKEETIKEESPAPDSDDDCVIVKVIKLEPKSSASQKPIKSEPSFSVKWEPSPTPTQKPLTREQRLAGFQQLCRECGLVPADDIDGSKARLKGVWVNIIDLIDAKRMSKQVDVWTNWEAFRGYTLDPEHRIDVPTAKQSEFLECFLQKLWRPGEKRRGKGKARGVSGGVLGGAS